MHKPTDSFSPNQRARSGLCHSLPIDGRWLCRNSPQIYRFVIERLRYSM